MFLTVDLLPGHLRHHLKSVDYFKLLWMNLEQQCVVCFNFVFYLPLFWRAMADLRLDRVIILWRPSKHVARKRWSTAT